MGRPDRRTTRKSGHFAANDGLRLFVEREHRSAGVPFIGLSAKRRGVAFKAADLFHEVGGFFFVPPVPWKTVPLFPACDAQLGTGREGAHRASHGRAGARVAGGTERMLEG